MKTDDFHIPRLKRVINALFAIENEAVAPGLFNGKTGVALGFYHLSRRTGNDLYLHFAEKLIDESIGALNENTPLDFAEGIAGIGWAIEYLVRNGFIDADTDHVLEDFDIRIAESLVSQADMSADILLGFAFYYYARLKWRRKVDSPLVNTLRRNVEIAIAKLDEVMLQTVPLPDDGADFLWTFPWYIWIKSRFSDGEVADELAYAIQKMVGPGLHPVNKWFLRFMAGAAGLPGDDMAEHSCLVQLRSPLVKDGLAGAILLLGHFSNGSRNVVEELNKRLEEYDDDLTSPAGYSVLGSNRGNRAGVIEGMAGLIMGYLN